MNSFRIDANRYLKQSIQAYYHQDYLGYREPGNPDSVVILKNTFDDQDAQELNQAANELFNIMQSDIFNIVKKQSLNFRDFMLIAVPRSKMWSYYSLDQLIFKEIVSRVAKNLNLKDGTNSIMRIKNTKTTHLSKAPNRIDNDPLPYPGITKATCLIAQNKIFGQNIILIDDIYTKSINIDEDCIQALLDNGAKQVFFYAIGRTKYYGR